MNNMPHLSPIMWTFLYLISGIMLMKTSMTLTTQ